MLDGNISSRNYSSITLESKCSVVTRIIKKYLLSIENYTLFYSLFSKYRENFNKNRFNITHIYFIINFHTDVNKQLLTKKYTLEKYFVRL